MRRLPGSIAAALALVLVGLAAATAAVTAAPSTAAAYSRLAIPLVAGDNPTLILAQRTIDRSWGPSDDSIYVEVAVPDWRHEGAALGLSAAVPGLGQEYVGDRMRGLWFAAAEIAGWTARLLYRHRGDHFRDMASSYAGVPSDSTSRWSLTRWARSTQSDPSQLAALYAADPDAFYELIATDSRYLAGWGGNASESQGYVARLREVSDDRLRFARYATTALWLNHLAAAVDALRAARLHNLALKPNTSLRLESGWRNGPTVTAKIERRF
jgi:hypothetical protein